MVSAGALVYLTKAFIEPFIVLSSSELVGRSEVVGSWVPMPVPSVDTTPVVRWIIKMVQSN